MSFYFTGSELSSFNPSSSAVTEVTSYGINPFGHDTDFSRCSIELHGVNYMDTPQFAALTECWTHCKMLHTQTVPFGTGAALTGYPIVWKNGSDVDVYRLAHDCKNWTLDLEYNDGSGWTGTGAPATVDFSNLQTIDFRLISNSSAGKLELYVGGTRLINATVDTSGIASIRKVHFLGGSDGGFDFQLNISEVIVANETTVGLDLMTFYPSGAGATSGWTGAYTAIDETVLDDSDEITSGTANQVSTFAMTPVGSLPVGMAVRALSVYARSKKSGSGPAQEQLAVRSNGTNYFSATHPLDFGFSAEGNIWETDPDTSSAWGDVAAFAVEPGVKSIT